VNDPQRAHRLLARIEAEVEARSDEIVATLVAAAAIPSEVPPGAYKRIIDHFAVSLEELGLKVDTLSVPPDVVDTRIRRHRSGVDGPRLNLLATDTADRRPLAAFYCHLDTVPAGDPRAWSFDPYAPFVRDGFVWGRGS